MFYLSGSSKVSSDQPGDSEKFNNIYHSFNQYNDLKPFHKNKFYDTASVFYIPQQYFGERIHPGSFQLTARSGSSTNKDKQIIILDDNNGNLYAPSASHSQSAASHLSSSANYVGNIYYDLGVVALTETGSWSGSINYTDIGGKEGASTANLRNYKYWTLNFLTTTPIYTQQYSVKIPAGSFNTATNVTTRRMVSGSLPPGTNLADYTNIRSELTGSDWRPYFNQIQLYRSQGEDPILIANLPRSIQMRNDIDLIITFRIDL
jgi:hypothetical protein